MRESACLVRESGDFYIDRSLHEEGTFYVLDVTAWSRDLRVTADGEGVVSLAGAVPLRMLADRSGLTGSLSGVLARRDFLPLHDRGRVLTDVAVAIAAGARDIVDIEALRGQAAVFGPVASDTTVLRALGEIGDTRRSRIGRARAAARANIWAQLPGGVPESTFAAGMCEPGTIVLRVDGTLVISHSKKDRSAGTFKKTFGHHPLGVWIDNTGELASLMLRSGNAGSNTAADLIAVLAEAIGQVPKPYRGKLLVTCDAAGASHELVNWLIRQNHAADRTVGFSIGFDVDADVRAAITKLRPDCWIPALNNTTGAARDDADVADITNLMRPRVERCNWPKTLTFTVRRTKLALGEAPTLFTMGGYKYSCFVTSKTTLSVQRRDARHRVHARVEDRVRTTKDAGLDHLPSKSWDVNLGWCHAVAIATDLIAWFRLLGCAGELAKAEPQTLRYRIFATPARLTRGQRLRWLRLPATWPWAKALVTAIRKIRALPMPNPG